MNNDAFLWMHDLPTGAADPSGPAGWYAVLICWDENEGMFPSSSYWTGSDWKDNRPKVAFHGPHPSQQDAENWAYDHDPDM